MHIAQQSFITHITSSQARDSHVSKILLQPQQSSNHRTLRKSNVSPVQSRRFNQLALPEACHLHEVLMWSPVCTLAGCHLLHHGIDLFEGQSLLWRLSANIHSDMSTVLTVSGMKK